MQLHELYTKGFIENNEKALNEFIQRFSGVMKKYAKYVNRLEGFDDLVSYFSERILYYHKKELEKERKIDFTDSKNEGILVKFTKECILQGVNLIKSRRQSYKRKFDFDNYLPIDKCYKVGKSSVEEEVTLKCMFDSLKEKIKKYLPDFVYKVFVTTYQNFGDFSEKYVQEQTGLSLSEIRKARRILQKFWRDPILAEERKYFLE